MISWIPFNQNQCFAYYQQTCHTLIIDTIIMILSIDMTKYKEIFFKLIVHFTSSVCLHRCWPFNKHGILVRIEPGCRPICHAISSTNHITSITIQRGISIRIRQQGQYSPTGSLQSPCGRPFLFQDIQTNLTTFEMNVGMKHLSNTKECVRRHFCFTHVSLVHVKKSLTCPTFSDITIQDRIYKMDVLWSQK